MFYNKGMIDIPRSYSAIVIFGPTASGKSGIALDLAKSINGAVINADASQLYSELSIITARPKLKEMQGVDHRLYGEFTLDQTITAQDYCVKANEAIKACQSAGKTPILCGGTGLYLKALIDGLHPVPTIPAEIRSAIRAMEKAKLHAVLAHYDPIMAAKLHPNDHQRLARAIEVYQATGKSLSAWQQTNLQQHQKQDQQKWFKIGLTPPRDLLIARQDERLRKMAADPLCFEELSLLNQKSIDPAHPLLKAIGVKEFTQHLKGAIPLDQAIAQSLIATRQYAKRQMTWLRHQFHADLLINPFDV